MIGVAFRSAVTPAGTLFRWVPPFGEAENVIYINGVNRSGFIEWDSVRKEETEGSQSNTLSFTCYDGFSLSKGQDIVFYRGGSLRREFAGTILDIEQFYFGIRHNIAYRVTCQDYTWLLGDERYCQKWAGAVSASTIAAAIVALKTGFTSVNVEASLATVTDFEIIFKTRGEALQMLADLVPGARWKVDYTKDVHFRTTPLVVDAPTDITDLSYSGDELKQKDSLSQARTRQRGLGVRIRIPAFVPSGSTNVPVEGLDRLPTSGQLLVGSRLLTFTNVSETQSPSGINGTAAAPTVALASSPAGGVLGAVRYAVTFETPDGEYPIGAQSSQVTGATLAAPSAGSAAVQHSTNTSTGGSPADFVATSLTVSRSSTTLTFTLSGMVVGARVYFYGGSTGSYDGAWTIGAVSGTTCSIFGVSSAGAASESVQVQVMTAGPLIGTYNYKFAFVGPRGITALSNAFSVSPAACAPTTDGTAVAGSGGSLSTGFDYYYYYAAYTETTVCAPAQFEVETTGVSDDKITLTMNQLTSGTGWADQRIRGIRLYRGRGGEQRPRLLVDYSREQLRALGAFAGSWTHEDTTADTSLGGLPLSDIAGAAVGISSLPSWSDARTTGLMILRTEAGGSTYYPLTTIGNSSITTYLDTTSDAELVANGAAPTAGEFGGHSVSLTSIATGPTGTTARNIYRLFNGVWRYCGTIPDNTTTTFTDDRADDELGKPFAIGGYLTGISATSTDIRAGEVGRLHVVRNDASAQTALATRIGNGHDGIVEGPVIDDDTLGQDGLIAACDAKISTYSDGTKGVTFRSRDVNLAPGYRMTITLGGTTQISGTFAIQRVTTSEYNRANDLQPLRQVTAGPVLSTLRKTLAA